MAVVAVGCDPLVAFLCCGLKTDNNGFLTNVEVAEAANQAHAIKLAGLFFETTDKEHVLVVLKELFLRYIRFGCLFARGHVVISSRAADNSLMLNYA